VSAIEINPGGWVNLCAGIAFDSIGEHPLRKILADYDPEMHPIISVLAQEGRAGPSPLAAARSS